MGAFDQTARRSAKIRPEPFLDWIVPGFRKEYQFLDWHDTQTVPFPSEPDRICDTVAELREVSEPHAHVLFDIEFQTENDPDILERVGECALRLRRERRWGEDRTGKYDVGSVVVNLTGPPQIDTLDMSRAVLGGGHRLWARVITVREEDAQTTLTRIEQGELDLCILPWIPLMRGADESDIIEQWRELAEREEEDRFRKD